MQDYIAMENVKKEYKMGEVVIPASNGVSFSIKKGEFVVIVGASGAGKTTVLNMLGGMDSCDSGKILVDGADISRYNRRQLDVYKRQGFWILAFCWSRWIWENMRLSEALIKRNGGSWCRRNRRSPKRALPRQRISRCV